MNSWHDYLHSDKVLLATVLFALIGVWTWTREPKLFELASTIAGALLAVITGTAVRGMNGRPPGETDGRPKP